MIREVEYFVLSTLQFTKKSFLKTYKEPLFLTKATQKLYESPSVKSLEFSVPPL